MTIGALILWLVTAILPGAQVTISDDSPLFDCRYMGNEQCGPDSTNHILGYW